VLDKLAPLPGFNQRRPHAHTLPHTLPHTPLATAATPTLTIVLPTLNGHHPRSSTLTSTLTLVLTPVCILNPPPP